MTSGKKIKGNGEGLTVALKFRSNETKMEYHRSNFMTHQSCKINLLQEFKKTSHTKPHDGYKSNYSPFLYPHFTAHRFFDTFFSLLYPRFKK